jgi:hypothetical protein
MNSFCSKISEVKMLSETPRAELQEMGYESMD